MNSETVRLRLAYFSPLPPARSGIADFSAELLPYLAHSADITLYVDDLQEVKQSLREQFEIRLLDRYQQEHWQYDLALYQMGNSEFHESLYPYLLHYPGVVVLHDLFVHHFIVHKTLGKGKFADYARELGYVLGKRGIYLAQEIRRGQASAPLFQLPLNERILDASLGIIANSEYVAAYVRAYSPGTPVRVIPLLARFESGKSRRHELGLDAEDILFASFGLITQAKQIERILETLSLLREHVANAHLLLVGDSVGDTDLAKLLQAYELTDVVHQVGYVPEITTFTDWIHTADVVINLRYPTVGESSSTALRAMAIAKPVIVYDHGWYAELPDTAVVKIPPLDQDALLDSMTQLSRSPKMRTKVGQSARQYAETNCQPSSVAALYISALQATLDNCLKRYA